MEFREVVDRMESRRNYGVPEGTGVAKCRGNAEDLFERSWRRSVQPSLRDSRIEEPRTTINRHNCRMCGVTRVKSGIFAVLFERTEKPSLPGMAVGEKQKTMWAANIIITFRGVAP
jgi:hypothetical protein